jgi:hypothetical protein
MTFRTEFDRPLGPYRWVDIPHRAVIGRDGGNPAEHIERGAAVRQCAVQALPLRTVLASLTIGEHQQFEKLARYITERDKVDEETRRLTGLFREALALPSLAGGESMECPLCGVENALMPTRIAYIRSQVAATEPFQTALREANDVLGQTLASARGAAEIIVRSLPVFITNPSRFRRTRGFRIERICALLGDETRSQIDKWLLSLRRTVRARTKVLGLSTPLAAMIARYIENPDSLIDLSRVTSGFSA